MWMYVVMNSFAGRETDATKLENVQFEASWQGTNISSVELELQATFNLRTASLLLRGLYSKSEYSFLTEMNATTRN